MKEMVLNAIVGGLLIGFGLCWIFGGELVRGNWLIVFILIPGLIFINAFDCISYVIKRYL